MPKVTTWKIYTSAFPAYFLISFNLLFERWNYSPASGRVTRFYQIYCLWGRENSSRFCSKSSSGWVNFFQRVMFRFKSNLFFWKSDFFFFTKMSWIFLSVYCMRDKSWLNVPSILIFNFSLLHVMTLEFLKFRCKKIHKFLKYLLIRNYTKRYQHYW